MGVSIAALKLNAQPAERDPMIPPTCSHLPCAALLAVALAVWATGCGGGEAVNKTRAKAPPNAAGAEIAYNQACYSLGATHAQSVRAGRYRPVTLRVQAWPAKDATVRAGQTLPEAGLTAALSDGRLRSVFVLGRGGVGKSELARMVQASVCGSARVVRLALAWDVVPTMKSAPEAANLILNGAAKRMKLVGADPKAAIDKAMAGRPWLLLLDGLDEVALSQRPRLLRDIKTSLAAMADMRLVVLARPPVFRDAYGLQGLQARVEVPPLPCAEVQRILRGGGPGDDRATALRKFVARYELDRKSGTGAACVFPHLSTWRDLAVVRSLARVHTEAKLAARAGGRLQRNRAGIYQAYLDTLLLDDLVGQDIGPAEALELVDAMIDAGSIRPDSRTVSLTLPECLARVGKGGEAARRARCQALLQSTLFTQVSGEQAWYFANQSIADLFLARRLDRQLTGKGAAGCAQVIAGDSLDECNEIAGFFLGLPRGRQCALEVADRLCERAVPGRLNLLLDFGLPDGVDRARLLHAARQRAGASGIKACARKELDKLWQALPEATRHEATRPKP